MSTSNNLPNSHPHPPAPSTVEDLSNLLREVGTANPQELLGAGARTSLAVAMLQATVATVLLMAALTFGPYLWSPATGTAAPSTPATPPEPARADSKAPTPPAVPESGKPAREPGNEASQQAPVSKKALEKLGLTDTRKADPRVNPLEKGDDDLLKELDKK